MGAEYWRPFLRLTYYHGKGHGTNSATYLHKAHKATTTILSYLPTSRFDHIRPRHLHVNCSFLLHQQSI